VSQGIIGIECRSGDARTRDLLGALDDSLTHTAMQAERSFAARLGGSCQSPIAAYAELGVGEITLTGVVAEPDGSRLIRDSQSAAVDNPAALGRQLAERMLAAGAGPLLERLRTA
jgi:hydroxymethylbilane synthase